MVKASVIAVVAMLKPPTPSIVNMTLLGKALAVPPVSVVSDVAPGSIAILPLPTDFCPLGFVKGQ